MFLGSTECMFSEPSKGQYFGTEGQTLCFQLPNTANTEITLKKDDKHLILKVKNQIVILKGEYAESCSQNQSKLSNSGTFNLGKAIKRDSGNYTLEEFRSNGALLKKVTVHLEIQGRLKMYVHI